MMESQEFMKTGESAGFAAHASVRRSRPRGSMLLAAALLFTGAAAAAFPCTTAVCSGKATRDGRPLLWKNRDASNANNRMMAFTGLRHNFVGVVDAEDVEGRNVWAGLNTAGFAIMNALADDLALPAVTGPGNGELMKIALGECATIADFEDLLRRTGGQHSVTANFGVIDAAGGACFFETGPRDYVKFDAADPRVAPFGYIVRTNYAFSSPDPLRGGGFIRFERASRLFERARGENALDARFILREACRDIAHDKLHSYPLSRPLPGEGDGPLYINTNDTINRNSTVSVAVFHGAPSPEAAHLATMWVLLGQPAAGVAVPVWAGAGSVPPATAGETTAPLCDFDRALVKYLYPDGRGRMTQYLNVTRLRTYGGEGVLPKLFRIEDEIMARAAERLRGWTEKPPDAAETAQFQNELAALALSSLRAAFPDIR